MRGLALILLLVGPHLPGVAAVAQSPHPAVCRVVVPEHGGTAFGSGTLIDKRDGFGLVVSNWHVVRDATGPIEVRFPDGFTSVARPVKLDETWDLAALVIWAPSSGPVALAGAAPQPGDSLTICGYGQGAYRAATGRCTDYYAPEIGKPHELLELNVEARQGDSGGPIFNERGELAGVLFGAGQGTTLGSFGGRVHSFLAAIRPDIGRAEQTLIADTKPTGPRALLGRPTMPPVELADAPIAKTNTAPPQPEAELERPMQFKPQHVAQAPVFKPAPREMAAHEVKPVTPLPDDRASPKDSQITEKTTAEGLDLHEDARTMLAVAGIAAVAVHVARMGK